MNGFPWVWGRVYSYVDVLVDVLIINRTFVYRYIIENMSVSPEIFVGKNEKKNNARLV